MAQVVIGVRELERLSRHVAKTAQTDLFDLLDAIGQQQEDAARRRILETKRGPDGRPWAVWSERHARTRKGQHSLLRESGSLLDSLTHQIDEDGVQVGSNLVYAGVHLLGSEDDQTPARPFLDTDGGFADSHDRAELRAALRDWMQENLI